MYDNLREIGHLLSDHRQQTWDLLGKLQYPIRIGVAGGGVMSDTHRNGVFGEEAREGIAEAHIDSRLSISEPTHSSLGVYRGDSWIGDTPR